MTKSRRERFTQFNVGNEKRYIDKLTDQLLSESEFNDIVTANYEKDKKRGYEDRMVGYYDKWYRYNRLDDGAAYDEGVQLALKQPNCVERLNIIPA